MIELVRQGIQRLVRCGHSVRTDADNPTPFLSQGAAKTSYAQRRVIDYPDTSQILAPHFATW